MKLVLKLFVLLVLAAGLLSWKLSFWTPPGRTFHVGSWTFGGHEFQVWQRKNEDFSEPFTTALFVRSSTNQIWQIYSLDHQDFCAPTVRLHQKGFDIEVVKEHRYLGTYDLKAGTYLRVGQAAPIHEGTILEPKHWWLANDPTSISNKMRGEI